MEENYNPSQRLGKGFVVEFIQKGDDGKLIYDKSFAHDLNTRSTMRSVIDRYKHAISICKGIAGFMIKRNGESHYTFLKEEDLVKELIYGIH